MEINRYLLVGAAVIGIAGMAAGQAIAAELMRASSRFDEMTVTVRKTEENLQEVPLSVTAFGQQEIQDSGIRNLYDVAAFTPGMTFSNVFGDFLPSPVIRGMAPTDIFGENNAAMFVDGVYISGRESINFSQLDIERIEVVKGPQSAMYGRNAFSGAINIISGNPGDVFESVVEGIVGNDGRLRGSATVSGPLVADTLSGRLAVTHDEWDGSYDNANPRGDQNIGGYEFDTVQGKLIWTPTEAVDVSLAGYYSDDQVDPPGMVGIAANCEDRDGVLGQPAGTRMQNYCGTFRGIGSGDIAVIPEATGEDREVARASLTIDWDIGIGTITSLSGYGHVDHESREDASWNQGDAYPWIYVNSGGQFSSFPSAVLRVDDGSRNDEWTQELRWISPQEQRIRYTVGLYFYSVTRKTYEPTLIAQQPLPGDFAGLCPCIGPFFPNGPIIPFGTGIYMPWFTPNGSAGANANLLNEKLDTSAWATFGAVDMDFTSQLTGRLELRYTDEEKKIVLPLDATVDSRKDSWDSWTGRGSLTYRLSDSTMFYASVAKGEKSGGFDSELDTVLDQTVVVSFDPEKNWTYEIGYKPIFLDGRVFADIAVFYIDWSEIVIPQTFEEINGMPLGIPLALSSNAGDATIKGVELSLQAALTEGLTLHLGGSWTDSEYDNAKISSFATWPSFYPDGDVSGKKMLRQSEWQGNASLTWRRSLTKAWELYSRGDVLFQGDQFVGADNESKIPSRTTVNLRLGLDSERFQVELWSENLFDEDAPTGAFRDVFFNNTPNGMTSTSGDVFPWRLSVSQPRRRTWGVTGRVRF